MKAGALTELLKTVFFIQLASEFWEFLSWSFLHMSWHKPNYPYFFKMLGKWATTGLENSGLWRAVIFNSAWEDYFQDPMVLAATFDQLSIEAPPPGLIFDVRSWLL